MFASASCGPIAIAASHPVTVLMVTMFLVTAISGNGGLRNQDHPGPKRGSEHQRGNRLERTHFNLLFILVKTPTNRSPPGNDNLEVLAWYNKAVLAAAVHPLKQLDDFSLQGFLLCRLQRRERTVGRPVVSLEDIEPMTR